MIFTAYLQGKTASYGLAFGPVGVGMTFLAMEATGTLVPTTSSLGPLVNAGQYALSAYQAASPFIPGTLYTVTAVIPDPLANPGDVGAHPTNIDDHVYDPGDQVTLSGGIGTVSALVLSTTLRIS